MKSTNLKCIQKEKPLYITLFHEFNSSIFFFLVASALIKLSSCAISKKRFFSVFPCSWCCNMQQIFWDRICSSLSLVSKQTVTKREWKRKCLHLRFIHSNDNYFVFLHLLLIQRKFMRLFKDLITSIGPFDITSRCF